MGILGDVGNFFGEVTGFGSNGNPDPHNLNDAAYEDYYQQALNDIQGTASGTQLMREKIQNAVLSQLAGLDDNMAGRKKNFEEDMSRSFGNNIQQRARAAGGTGNLAQVLNPGGAAYDAEARARARGFNDLYSQATNDIGKLQGVQGNLEGQDFRRGSATANLRMDRIGQRMGVAKQNAENDFNSEQAGRQRRMNTMSAITSLWGNSKS